jgi:hypothetical protein
VAPENQKSPGHTKALVVYVEASMSIYTLLRYDAVTHRLATDHRVCLVSVSFVGTEKLGQSKYHA